MAPLIIIMSKKLAYVLGGSIAVLVILIIVLFIGTDKNKVNSIPSDGKENETTKEAIVLDAYLTGDNITQMLLTPNEYSRPQDELKKVNGIVIHYVGNPGTSAQNNRNYFENLKDTKERSASSHYIVGLKGEIIQCIPLNEISYASNNRNYDTIAIEVCHPDSTGKFSAVTYEALVELTAALCRSYKLDPTEDILRHYDVSGKECPIYYVKNEGEWNYFLVQVNSKMKK